ncbi:hypothetical protein LCGC14_1879120 [marine sediment metagenome]|uniref:Uncharacterized protein n=1 Tax=marine sediment metagenome TaxID=412755 RepID=A0A0F9J1B2_9ZZZZ
MIEKGTKVWWLDGIGYKHKGVVASDTDTTEFMIPVRTGDDRILHIRYLDLHIESNPNVKCDLCGHIVTANDFAAQADHVYIKHGGYHKYQ